MKLFIICLLTQVVLCFISFTLHMISLPASHWALFNARINLGLPEEHGHYGLFSLCSIKAPLYRDDCDPLDTFFRPPPHMWSAGMVAVIHAVILGLFFPFALLRLQQISGHKHKFVPKPKTIIVMKISLIVIAAVLVGIILLLTTLRESISRQELIFHTSTLENYEITKGWAFWLEVIVAFIDAFILILCVIELNQLKQLDPTERSSYLANPSPNSMTRLSVTSEYFNPHFRAHSFRDNQQLDPISTISDHSFDGWSRCNSNRCQLDNKSLPFIQFGSTSFNNPAFCSESPDLRRCVRF